MRSFLSTYQNKMDAKRRVSVPAAFRQVLKDLGSDGLVCYPHPDKTRPAIEICSSQRFQRLADTIESLPPFSPRRKKLGVFLRRAQHLSLDKEGRIMLPETMVASSGLTETCVFTGEGDVFHIWHPDALQVQEDALELSQEDLEMGWDGAFASETADGGGGA